MTPETLRTAIAEAERFLKVARRVRIKVVPKNEWRDEYEALTDFTQTGAARRASMDLTRALAAMRKHGD